MPQLNANGLQIEYNAFGDRNDDPILLIMGLGTQMIAWSADFCNALVGRGHYVIRFDNRDVGLSTKFDGMNAPSRCRYALNHFFNIPLNVPYSLEDMAADAVGVLEALDIETAHVVGASMGGMIAKLVTANYPGSVKSLTSIMSSSGDADAMINHMLESVQLIGGSGYPRSDEECREFVIRGLTRSFYPQGFARHLAAIIADGSRVRRLHTIDKPTLVIHGRDDPLVPLECGIDTARHTKGAKLEIIDGMGHDIPSPLVGKLARLIANHALPKH